MLRKLNAGVLAVCFMFPTVELAAEPYECGFMPLPPGATLQYFVYDGTGDAKAIPDTMAAYEALIGQYPEYFSAHPPTIKFVERTEDIFASFYGGTDLSDYRVMIVIGDEEIARALVHTPIESPSAIAIIPRRTTIEDTVLEQIEQLTGTDYYIAASSHAIQRGTFLLVDESTNVSTITADHILSMY